MSELVAQGTLVWVLFVGLSAVVLAVVASRRVGRARRREVRAARARFADARSRVEELEAGRPVVLRGILRVAPGGEASSGAVVAASAASPRPDEDVMNVRAPDARLAVEVEGGAQVVLRDEACVLVGSSEASGRIARDEVKAISSVLERFFEQAGAVAGLRGLRLLREGDVVVARGVLARVPDAGALRGGDAYRAGAHRLELGGEDGGVVLLAYARGGPSPLSAEPTHSARAAMAGGLGAFALAATVGEIAIRLRSDEAIELAAATPFRRDDALAELRLRTHAEGPRDNAAVMRAATLDALRGGCASGVDVLLEHHHAEHALAIAVECEDPRREALALVAQGELARAADAFERARRREPQRSGSLLEASVLLVGEKHTLASDVLRRVPLDAPRARQEVECVARAIDRLPRWPSARRDVIALQHGEPPARDDLPGPACKTELLQLGLHAAEEDEVLGTSAPVEDRDEATRYLLALLRVPADRVTYRSLFHHAVRPASVLAHAESGAFALPPALSARVLRHLAGRVDRTSAFTRAALELHLAQVDAWRGDVEAAWVRVRRARADVRVGRTAAPDVDPGPESVELRISLMETALVSRERSGDDHADVARRIAAALAARAEDASVLRIDEPVFFGETARADRRHWIRLAFPAPCTTCSLERAASYVGARREAARSVFDEELVPRTEAVLRKIHASAFDESRIDIAVPLSRLAQLELELAED